MSKRSCEHPNCTEAAGYVCDGCGCDYCAEHVKSANYYSNDADDQGYKLNENGEYDVCEDCLNG